MGVNQRKIDKELQPLGEAISSGKAIGRPELGSQPLCEAAPRRMYATGDAGVAAAGRSYRVDYRLGPPNR
jgi:hypothetical protein